MPKTLTKADVKPDYRKTIQSVTCFLHCGDDYLFIHRTKRFNKVDGGRLNGIGGKVKVGETFQGAAIREIEEETGLVIKPEDCVLKAIGRLEEGYSEDWVVCFFVIEVPDKKLPLGPENDEGQLVWLKRDKVHSAGYELVDDLNYVWDEITIQPGMFFFSALLDDDEKIKQIVVEQAVVK